MSFNLFLLALGVIPGATGVRDYAGTPSAGTNAVQTITLGTASGGTYKVKFRDAQSAALAYNADAAAIQVAMRAMTTINGANVTVTGSAGGPYTVTFIANLAALLVDVITIVNVDLTGGTAPTVANTTPGVTATHRGCPKGGLVNDVTNNVLYTNSGTPTAPTWTKVSAT
jgi:hypothetical protein